MFFFKKKLKDLPVEDPDTEIDWDHKTIVHHVLYAQPSATHAAGGYPVIGDEEFAPCLDEAREAISTLDFDLSSVSVMEPLSLLHELPYLINIAETRTLHQRTSVSIKTDVEQYQLGKLLAQLELYKSARAEKLRELERLTGHSNLNKE